MSIPQGKPVTIAGLNPSGELRQAELDASDNLKVAVVNLVTPAGASFPATPAAGDLFWRTDLDLLCYYDGTRWLTAAEYSLPVAGISVTVDTTTFINRVRADHAPYYTRVVVTTNVAPTNDGTKYWTVSVRGYNAAFSAATEVYAANTSADAASVYVEHDGNASTPNPSNNHFFAVSLVKTSTPGALTVYVTAYYRLIVT